LLSIYLSAMTLLVLGGIALQRTAVESRAAQVSRDLAQAFWGTEAAFDKAVLGLRADALPAFDSVGCAYAMIPFDPITQQVGSYMFCNTPNPEQYQVEMIGFGETAARPILWASAFVERETSAVTLAQAALGVDGIEVSSAVIGGTDTVNRPLQLQSLTTDGFGDDVAQLNQLSTTTGTTGSWTTTSTGTSGFGSTWYTNTTSGGGTIWLNQNPQGWVTNRGDLATFATQAGAVSIANNSAVLGEIQVQDPSAVTISADSQNTETQLASLSVSLTDVPPIQAPANTPALTTILPSGSWFVDSQGTLTFTNATVTIPAGTYTVDQDLAIVYDSRLDTSGVVDLFVTGAVTIEKSIVTGKDPTQASEFYPANLHLFIQPADAADQVLVTRGALLAAIVYAPKMTVHLKRKAAFLGALVGKQVILGTRPTDADAYANTGIPVQAFFDLPVGMTPINPAPQEPTVTTLFYRANRSFSEATSRTALEQERMFRWWQFINGQNPIYGALLLAAGMLPPDWFSQAVSRTGGTGTWGGFGGFSKTGGAGGDFKTQTTSDGTTITTGENWQATTTPDGTTTIKTSSGTTCTVGGTCSN